MLCLRHVLTRESFYTFNCLAVLILGAFEMMAGNSADTLVRVFLFSLFFDCFCFPECIFLTPRLCLSVSLDSVSLSLVSVCLSLDAV